MDLPKSWKGLGITVKRPDTWPHEAKFSTIHWGSSKCTAIIVPAMFCWSSATTLSKRRRHPQPRRGNVQLSCVADGVYEVRRKVVQCPQTNAFGTSLFEELQSKQAHTPCNDEPAFDAANVLRFCEDLIYLVSATGNELGGHWPQSILGDKYQVHFLKEVYYGSHIDSEALARPYAPELEYLAKILLVSMTTPLPKIFEAMESHLQFTDGEHRQITMPTIYPNALVVTGLT